MSKRWVEVEFDCLPLRSVTRLDVPLDASPKYEQFVLRVKAAITQHGSHNTYYLHGGKCVFHLTNDPQRGEIAFSFEGTAMTCSKDRQTKSVDLTVELSRETCGWLERTVCQLLTRKCSARTDRRIRSISLKQATCRKRKNEFKRSTTKATQRTATSACICKRSID